MLRRYELTDEEWNRIAPLLPPENTGKQGRPRKDLPLTIEPTEVQKAEARRSQILYKPSCEEVFGAIIPEYVAGVLYGAVCESVASELAARRTAMDAATKNAGEMIEHLNLYYNRARQAAITQEITEIVAGAEN